MLTLQYAAGIEGFRYEEITIYGKMHEAHPLHTLSLNLSQNQPWGSANVGLEGGQYLDAMPKNYGSLFVGTNVRLFKGFNVNLSGTIRPSAIRCSSLAAARPIRKFSRSNGSCQRTISTSSFSGSTTRLARCSTTSSIRGSAGTMAVG